MCYKIRLNSFNYQQLSMVGSQEFMVDKSAVMLYRRYAGGSGGVICYASHLRRQFM